MFWQISDVIAWCQEACESSLLVQRNTWRTSNILFKISYCELFGSVSSLSLSLFVVEVDCMVLASNFTSNSFKMGYKNFMILSSLQFWTMNPWPYILTAWQNAFSGYFYAIICFCCIVKALRKKFSNLLCLSVFHFYFQL